jgi:hypothetical protein
VEAGGRAYVGGGGTMAQVAQPPERHNHTPLLWSPSRKPEVKPRVRLNKKTRAGELAKLIVQQEGLAQLEPKRAWWMSAEA